MDFTPRMKQILQVLSAEEAPISVKTLAERVGVSKRTVQRELEYVESSLKGYDVRFLSRTGVGVWLEGNTEAKEILKRDLGQGTDYDVSNREERRKRLILEILKEKGLKKLFYYSSQFGVSEENYRRAIRAFISENIDTGVIRESYEERDWTAGYYETLRKSSIGKVLDDDIVKRVMDCIIGVDNPRIRSLTENSYVGLVIHLSIAMKRILKNEVVEADHRWEDENDADYQLAEAIVRELEEEFEVHIPRVELSYICLHIKGAKHEKIRWDVKAVPELENQQIQRMVNEIIDAFDPERAYLLKQDEEFIQGLLAHLQPTLIRLVQGMQIRNPVLKDIQANYPDIYGRCERVANVLAEAVGKKVPQEEIGFLTVHFGAAMVRLEGRSEKIRNFLR